MPNDSPPVEHSTAPTPGQSTPTADPSSADPSPTKNQLGYLQSSVGIACLFTVAANLGVPLLQNAAALQILLVLVGFCLARVVHRSATSTEWRLPLLLGLAGRAIPTVILVTTLVAVHGLVTGGLSGGETAALISAGTMTSTVVPFALDAFYFPVEHIWVVALVVQVAILAPWILTAGRQRLGPFRRSIFLVVAAAVAGAVRVAALVLTEPTAWITPIGRSWIGVVAVWTSLDALLIGMAMATVPLANLHRNPTTRAVIPALIALALLLVGPMVGIPAIDLGLRLPAVALLTAVVLASEAISSLPRAVATVLTTPFWHQLGARAFGLYLWHIPFAYGLTNDDPFRWQGVGVFAVILTLSLAAATTTYRSIELPAQAALQRFATKWYPPESVIPPALAPDRRKWVRWDEISLDHLPVPTRRRGHRRISGRSNVRRQGRATVDHIDLSRTAPIPVSHRTEGLPAEGLPADRAVGESHPDQSAAAS